MDNTKTTSSILIKIFKKNRFFIKRLGYGTIFFYYKMFKKSRFKFNGDNYNYFFSLYNETFKNERAVEIPIVMKYVKEYKGKNILEVGNVLSHYFNNNHTVIDKYEKAESILNYDITEYKSNEKFDLIVSISTLEHIGWDEYSRYGNTVSRANNPNLLLKAVDNLKNMLNPDGVLIATMPLGFNKFLDSLVKDNKLDFSEIFFLKRESQDNKWKEVSYADVENILYAHPFPCANGVIVAKFYNVIN